jgi:hypothetical protein
MADETVPDGQEETQGPEDADQTDDRIEDHDAVS